MDLVKNERPAKVTYDGNDTFTLSAGTRYQVRDNETGEIVNRLDETVLAGKQWVVSLHMSIIETDT